MEKGGSVVTLANPYKKKTDMVGSCGQYKSILTRQVQKFELYIDTESKTGPFELSCRGFNEEGKTQPEDPREMWNFKGYNNNCVHKINLIAIP